GVDDDRDAEGQDAGGGRRAVPAVSPDGDDAAGPAGRGHGQAVVAGRRARVPDPREVRQPGVAHVQGRAGERADHQYRTDMNRLPMIPQEQPRQDLPPEGGSHETEGLVADPVKTEALGPAIQAALKKVYDPEIPVDIYELGLIYDLFVTAGGVAAIKMTLTAPACPAAQILPGQVADAAKSVAGVTDARVDVVWEPAWTKDRMSDVAKLQLGMW